MVMAFKISQYNAHLSESTSGETYDEVLKIIDITEDITSVLSELVSTISLQLGRC